jgi:hypothetical protein
MTLEQLTLFFGWGALINIAILLVSAVFILAFRGFAISMHQKMFGIETDDLNLAYFKYLAQYKIINLCFFITPYFALLLIQ